jgi:hypothetical protein
MSSVDKSNSKMNTPDVSVLEDVNHSSNKNCDVTSINSDEVEGKDFTGDYEPLVNPEQYEEYRFSVTAPDGLKSRKIAWLKMKYIMAELFADLGFRTMKKAEFWLTFLIICMTAWISRFTHYIGQWFFLKGEGIAIINFEAVKLTIDLDYASDTDLIIEIGVIVIGPLFSLAVFLFFVLLAWSI